MTWLAPSVVLWLAAGVAPTPDADAALARPLSPGAVVLLLEHVSDPRTDARIAEALRDQAPGVRAAAARVANVAGLQGLAPVLAEVLGKEANAGAALEELDALRSLELDQWTWSQFLEQAARGDQQRLLPVVALALRERDGALWRALLLGAADGWARVKPTDLAASIERDDELRAASLWHLVLTTEAGAVQPAPVAVALAKLLESSAGARPPALELLERLQQRPRGDLLAALAKADDAERGFWYGVAKHKHLRERLGAKEREALRTLLGLDKGSDWPWQRPDPPEEKPNPLRVATGYPPGFVEDTLVLSGCPPASGRDLGGITRRGEDGRPRHVMAFKDLAGSPECVRATNLLLANHLNRTRLEPRSGIEERLLLPLDPGQLACGASSEPSTPDAPRPTDGRIKEPRKVRNVTPRYPESARDNRVQGSVVLEAVISATGCIQEIELLRGVHPVLDVEAMRTVSRWVYSPTLLGGVPVPVIMTVTVNFKLH